MCYSAIQLWCSSLTVTWSPLIGLGLRLELGLGLGLCEELGVEISSVLWICALDRDSSLPLPTVGKALAGSAFHCLWICCEVSRNRAPWKHTKARKKNVIVYIVCWRDAKRKINIIFYRHTIKKFFSLLINSKPHNCPEAKKDDLHDDARAYIYSVSRRRRV